MLNGLFRTKPKPELSNALELIKQASETVMSHKRNKRFVPTKDEMSLLQSIENEFQSGYAMTSYVHRTLQQRIEGKPEGAAKFTDKEAADYHFPAN